jgi:hypothetical protein
MSWLRADVVGVVRLRLGMAARELCNNSSSCSSSAEIQHKHLCSLLNMKCCTGSGDGQL